MRVTRLLLLAILFVTASCNFGSGEVEITDAYSFATPAKFPVAAVFLTIENGSSVNDRMIDFKTPIAGRSELHTMSMSDDIMKMRRIDSYNVAVGDAHVLKPGGDHIMLFGVSQDLKVGNEFEAVAVFEQAGDIPVKISVRARDDDE